MFLERAIVGSVREWQLHKYNCPSVQPLSRGVCGHFRLWGPALYIYCIYIIYHYVLYIEMCYEMNSSDTTVKPISPGAWGNLILWELALYNICTVSVLHISSDLPESKWLFQFIGRKVRTLGGIFQQKYSPAPLEQQDLLSGKILHVKTNPKCSYLALSQFPAARVTFKRIKLCRSSHISGCRVNPYERILGIHRWWHPPFSKQVSDIFACSRAHLAFFLSKKELTSRSGSS